MGSRTAFVCGGVRDDRGLAGGASGMPCCDAPFGPRPVHGRPPPAARRGLPLVGVGGRHRFGASSPPAASADVMG
ncbi:hypothetical protein PV392_32110 [Streptomyces sp. ME03-5709C]|nr:hypothetical protein [Streptomyces sp. ME03-5709C]